MGITCCNAIFVTGIKKKSLIYPELFEFSVNFAFGTYCEVHWVKCEYPFMYLTIAGLLKGKNVCVFGKQSVGECKYVCDWVPEIQKKCLNFWNLIMVCML